MRTVILGSDPGTTNYALSCIAYTPDAAKENRLQVIGTRMAENPIKFFDATLQDQFKAFVAEVSGIKRTYDPDLYIVERFQTRGNGGNTIESISMMNALALQIMRNSDPMLVTASTWKNAANRQGINLKELYLQYKMTSKKSVKAIHEFDAAMMAVYRLYISLDRTPFFGFDVHSFIDKVWASPRL